VRNRASETDLSEVNESVAFRGFGGMKINHRVCLAPLMFVIVGLFLSGSSKPVSGQPGGRPRPAPTSKTTSAGTPRSSFRPQNPHIELVRIPPGKFMMGSMNGFDNEKPVHEVTINYSFYMGKYEVTEAQWQAVMDNNPSQIKGCGANCPVEGVSWNEVQQFIRRLNQLNNGYTYRLPTEAEWEYACRAGTTGDYYAADVEKIGWDENNAGKKKHPVGQKKPNAFGLYDMSGNVSEYCMDRHHDNYNGAPIDGGAWLRGGEPNRRVSRGGDWFYGVTFCRSAARNNPAPFGAWDTEGFRIVASR
jgi:formylglycine-generating enzyme required for sulfatase activity